MCAFNKVLAHIVAMCDTNMPFIGLRMEVRIQKHFASFPPLLLIPLSRCDCLENLWTCSLPSSLAS